MKAFLLAKALDESQPHNDIETWVQSCYHKIVVAEQNRIINFDQYSKRVWHELNIAHKRERGSQQYESAFDAHTYTAGVIASITAQIKTHSPSKNMRSALETLRKIGKTICLSADTLGHEFQKHFQHGDDLECAKQSIVDYMSQEQRNAVLDADDDDGKGNFEEKMIELIDLCDGRCIFEGLQEVLDDLNGDVDAEGVDSAGDEDDEEDFEE